MLTGVFFRHQCVLDNNMKIETIEEIIACLPTGRTLFPYFRDRYAGMLLTWVIDNHASIADIKRTPYAPLLEKDSIKGILRKCGNGHLDKSTLQTGWSESHESFLLTLDHWGPGSRRHRQITRPGYNLVLQVNLHNSYLRAMESLFGNDYLQLNGHPVLRPQTAAMFRPTLAWVRLDLDLDTNEVLIEEIQSDFLRVARWYRSFLLHCKYRDKTQTQQLEFFNLILQRFGKLWSEAVMAAALWFIFEELGINTVWYHTHATGSKLKKIRGYLPPQSLYSQLPRQFCFIKTADRPEFLMRESSFKRDQRRIPNMEFYRKEKLCLTQKDEYATLSDVLRLDYWPKGDPTATRQGFQLQPYATISVWRSRMKSRSIWKRARRRDCVQRRATMSRPFLQRDTYR